MNAWGKYTTDCAATPRTLRELQAALAAGWTPPRRPITLAMPSGWDGAVVSAPSLAHADTAMDRRSPARQAGPADNGQPIVVATYRRYRPADGYLSPRTGLAAHGPVLRGQQLVGLAEELRCLADGHYQSAHGHTRGGDAPTVWQGSHIARSAPTDVPGAPYAAVDHALPGRRVNPGRARTDHVAWCREAVGRGQCQRYGSAVGWMCPDHPNGAVTGCDIPGTLDRPAKLLGRGARKPRLSPDSDATATTIRERVTGIPVRPEPTDVVMATGRYADRLRADGQRADGGKVLVYRRTAGLYGPADTRYVLAAIHNATIPTGPAGTRATVPCRVSPSLPIRRALARRDRNVTAVLRRQLAAVAPVARKRSAAATAAAAAGKRAQSAARVANVWLSL